MLKLKTQKPDDFILSIDAGTQSVRAVIFDFGLSAKIQKLVTWGLIVFGLLALLFGINTLMVFLRGNALLW